MMQQRQTVSSQNNSNQERESGANRARATLINRVRPGKETSLSIAGINAKA